MRKWIFAFLIFLPVIVPTALIIYHATHTAPQWQIPVTGYDPRDLLRGRYIRFQYDLPPYSAGQKCVSACVVCLNGDHHNPAITWAPEMLAPASCEAAFTYQPNQEQRFYIPESVADAGDALMRTQSDHITALVSINNSRAYLKTLLINGTQDIITHIREQQEKANE